MKWMPQNEEGSRMEQTYVQVPQTETNANRRERERERERIKKVLKQFKYSKYIEKRVRMHGKSMNMWHAI